MISELFLKNKQKTLTAALNMNLCHSHVEIVIVTFEKSDFIVTVNFTFFSKIYVVVMQIFLLQTKTRFVVFSM